MKIQIKSAWEDVFKESVQRRISGTKRRITVLNEFNYYVSFSSFNNFDISDNYSGVITAYKITTKMYIETSLFRNVILRSSKHTGTIYFNNRVSGEIALNKICLCECSVTNNVFVTGVKARVIDGSINHLNMSATCNNGNDKSI